METILDEMREILTAKLVEAGVDPQTVTLADVEETSISYMADESTRIRVKMVGDLSFTKRDGK